LRVMGVDPGINATGYSVIDGTVMLDFGTVRPKGELSHKLLSIHSTICGFIEKWEPDILAMEAVIYHKNPSTAIVMGAARGVVLLAAAQAGLKVVEISPTQVKKSITGTGRADKSSVKFMIQRIFNIKKPISEHAADSLAVAWCASQNTRF